MKTTAYAEMLRPYIAGMCCPKCGANFVLEGVQLQCGNRHCYDLSGKGYVNLAPGHDQNKEKYDAELFESRSRIFAGGFYDHVWSGIEPVIRSFVGDKFFTAADVGCGEGYYTRKLTEAFSNSRCYGIDLSRDGIQRAAVYRKACWLVGDLKHLPLKDCSTDVVLDVLTPADYESFRRILKLDGILIKVIPGNQYLKEIRESVKERLRNESFDNSRVVDHLAGHGRILERNTVSRTFELHEDQGADFLRMTPMTFGMSTEELKQYRLNQITVEMEILVARMDGES